MLAVEERIEAAVGEPPAHTWEDVIDQLNEHGFIVLGYEQNQALTELLDVLDDEADPTLVLSLLRTVFAERDDA